MVRVVFIGGKKDVRGLSKEFEGIRLRPDRALLTMLEWLIAAILLAPLERWFGTVPQSATGTTDPVQG